MARSRRKKIRTPVGAAPDVLVVPANAAPTVIKVTSYSALQLEEVELKHSEKLRRHATGGDVTWVDVQGLADIAALRGVAEFFELHPLVLADIVHVPQLPKAERYGAQFVFIGQFLTPLPGGTYSIEQVSLILSESWVVSFQENSVPDSFARIRERLQSATATIRRSGADYLAYAIIDLIVDSAFPILEDAQNDLLRLEDEALSEHGQAGFLARVQQEMREELELSRILRHQRKAVQNFGVGEGTCVKPATLIFLRDVIDHASEQYELVEQELELGRSVRSLHLTMLSFRINEIMRLLTILATIFMPLSFFASVYGMNFEGSASELNMPELRWRYGYVVWWLTAGLGTAGMLFWFWRRGWLRSDEI